MLALLYASLALAQSTIVALGDGPVAGTPEVAAERETETVPGGWIAVLADCLEERSPRRFTVVDRAAGDPGARSLLERVGELRELGPQVVVLGVGAREVARSDLAVDAFEAEVERLVAEVRKARPDVGVLLVGLVPPTLSQLPEDGPKEQGALEARTAAWNGALAAYAGRTEGVHHVDLQGDWPREGRARAALTVAAWRLSDQGHARVAAAVCDAVLAAWPE